MKSFKYSDFLKYKLNKQEIKINFEYLLKKYILFNNIESKGFVNEENSKYKTETENSYNKTQIHDKIYKTILSNKTEIANLINSIFKFKSKKFFITEDKIEHYNSSFITNNFLNRESDIVYKLKKQNIFFLIEHQSKIDYSMPFRLLEYCVLIMENAIDKNKIKNKDYKLPVIYPIIIYTGKSKWNDVKYLEDRQENLLGYSKSNRFTNYNLIDINNYEDEELLEKEGILPKIMLLEKVKNHKTLEEILEKVVKIDFTEEQKEMLKKILNYMFSEKIPKEKRNKFIKILECKKEETSMFLDVIEDIEKKGYKKGYKAGMNAAIKQNKDTKQHFINEMVKNNIEDKIIIKIANITEEELQEIKRNHKNTCKK